MAIRTDIWGKSPSGQDIHRFVLTNRSGASITVIEWGAILTSIIVPDKNGKLADVALGFDTLESYLKPHGSMGDTIGRYGNRIGAGKFSIDGVNYQVALNDHGINHLHGGNVGFNAHFWEGTPAESECGDSVRFHRISPNGEENYPGNLDVSVTYTWDEENNLIIRYQATTDKPTLCNLTNHTYFNLAGQDHGTIRDHVVQINADVTTRVDAGLIPTGDYYPVAGTPLDLRYGGLLDEGLKLTETCPQMIAAGGYDHNFVLNKGMAMGIAAYVVHEESGRAMEVLTDQPAIQLYTACTTDIKNGKGGMNYGRYSGLCLETQHCPDDPNHSNFPGTTILRPGEKYDTTTIYAFRIEE